MTDGVATEAAPQARRKARNGLIDLARFVGALGIVWFHLGLPAREIAAGAMPLFVTLLVLFGAGRPMGQRARRLLLPWLFWCGVYALLKIADGDGFEPWMLVSGPALHLWFLPYAFVVERLGLLLLPLSLLFPLAYSFPFPVFLWISSLPAAALGYALAKGASRYWCLVLAGISAVMHYFGIPAALGVAIGSLVVFAILSVSVPSRLAEYLGGVSFGIYLIHPIVIAILLRAGDPGPVAMFLGAAAGSIVITELCRRVVPWAV